MIKLLKKFNLKKTNKVMGKMDNIKRIVFENVNENLLVNKW
tara:strand:+ start:440 stop:562 length:123 start_codon:yes stop_codon:yes gene_type:complete